MNAALALLILPLMMAPAPVADDDGWKVLFDGKTLDGWEHVGPGEMVLKDGVMQTVGGMGLLWYTKEPIGDCQLRVEYRTSTKEANSGVFIRVDGKPSDEWHAVHHGYEVQICDVADPYHVTGSVYSFSKATATPSKPVGEWNTMIITLKGDQVLVEVNGVPVNDFDPSKPAPERTKAYEPERGPRPEKGYIGLQNHDAASRVEFRKVAVRPLKAS